MKYLTATAILSLLQSTPTMAQLQVSGPLTVGHSVKVVAPNVVSDAGPAAGGPAGTGLYELNVTKSPVTGPNGPAPSCLYDAPITAAAGSHQLCFDPYNSTYNTAVLSYNALGAASPVGLTVLINGTAYPFVGGGGNVVGPTSPAPTGGYLTLWNGGTNIKTANNGNGSNVLGVDPGNYGTTTGPLLVVGTSPTFKNGQAPLLAEINSGLPPSTVAFPVAISAVANLQAGSNGNVLIGLYAQTTNYATGGAAVAGAEIDVGNSSGVASDLSLPPIVGPFGLTAITPTGLSINCLIGSTSDCNTGIYIANNGGNANQPRFFTGIYLWWFRQNGLVIAAQPTDHAQNNIISQTNGLGYNVHLQLTGTYSASGVALISDNTTNSNSFVVRANGAAEASGGIFTGGNNVISPPTYSGNIASSALVGTIAHQAFGISNVPITPFSFARGTFAAPTVILTGDRTMNLSAYGYDGTSYQPTAQLISASEGTISTGIVPGNLTLATSNASGVLMGALFMDRFQNVMPSGTAAIATNAVSPFIYLTTTAGLPIGVPNAATAGRSAIVIDSTDHKICWYEQANAVWKCATGS